LSTEQTPDRKSEIEELPLNYYYYYRIPWKIRLLLLLLLPNTTEDPPATTTTTTFVTKIIFAFRAEGFEKYRSKN
jgi:hypothetical protein